MNVTGFLSSTGGLSFLVSSDDPSSTTSSLPSQSSSAFSPSMIAYKSALRTDTDLSNSSRSIHGSVRRAAGSVQDEGFSRSARMFVPPEAPEIPDGGMGKVARFLRLKQRRPKVAAQGAVGDSQAILGDRKSVV